MARWLSEQWVEECTSLAQSQPVRPGVSVKIQYVVTGGPDGDVEYYWVVEDGQLTQHSLGRLEDCDVVLTEDYADALRIQMGELDVNDAFLEGKVRAEGDIGKLFSLLPVTTSEEFRAFQAAVASITEV